MGDMGDIFNAQRAATREHRARMLAAADTSGWTQRSQWHFTRQFGALRVDWWPSGGKAQVHRPGQQPEMVYGHRKVAALVRRLNGEPETPKPVRVPCTHPGCRAYVRPTGLRDHVRDAHGAKP